MKVLRLAVISLAIVVGILAPVILAVLGLSALFFYVAGSAFIGNLLFGAMIGLLPKLLLTLGSLGLIVAGCLMAGADNQGPDPSPANHFAKNPGGGQPGRPGRPDRRNQW